jgi:hypothetical protein
MRMFNDTPSEREIELEAQMKVLREEADKLRDLRLIEANKHMLGKCFYKNNPKDLHTYWKVYKLEAHHVYCKLFSWFEWENPVLEIDCRNSHIGDSAVEITSEQYDEALEKFKALLKDAVER